MDKPIRRLATEKQVKLTLWMRDHKHDAERMTADQLADKASLDLGFEVSPCSTGLYRRTIFPEMSNKKESTASLIVADLIRRVESLERVVQGLCQPRPN
jgi:hypothetical protein